MERDGLIPVAKEAWKAFECAAPSSRVSPAMPILFFGDVEAYSASPFRVVTVGLNPSLKEFPEDSPFKRFPRCTGITAADSEQYLQGLCSYFRVHPYRRWFQVLRGRARRSGGQLLSGQAVNRSAYGHCLACRHESDMEPARRTGAQCAAGERRRHMAPIAGHVETANRPAERREGAPRAHRLPLPGIERLAADPGVRIQGERGAEKTPLPG